MYPISHFPDDWLAAPPHSLVVGTTAYTHTITVGLSASCLPAADLLVTELTNADNGIPQVLVDLKRVMVVADSSQSPAEVIRCHEILWQCLEKLSPDRDQHELVILFVMPTADKIYIDSLLMHWGLSRAEAANFGLGFAKMGDSLESLCKTLAAIRPTDLPPLVARQSRDTRHKSIRSLQSSTTSEDLIPAAKQVFEVFKACEYHLDLFCKPPAHQNGNRLRQILKEIVTESVTPDDYPDQLKEITQLLK